MCLSLQASPLHKAIREGDIVEVQKLINEGCDLNIQDMYDLAPLHLTASSGRVDLVKLLIASGAALDIKDDCGITPLHDAVLCNKTEVIRILIDSGADLEAKRNSDGFTPLHIAADLGKKDNIGLLILGGARLDSQDNDGNTPLSLSVYEENRELLSSKSSYKIAARVVGKRDLKQTLRKRKVKVQQFLLRREVGIKKATDRSLARFGKIKA